MGSVEWVYVLLCICACVRVFVSVIHALRVSLISMDNCLHIFITSYLIFSCTGNHWVLEIVKMLLTRTTKHSDYDLGGMLLECQEQSIIQQAASPRVMHAHVLFDKLPAEIFHKCKVISVVRDPRDAILSFYEYLTNLGYIKWTWSEYFENYMTGKGENLCLTIFKL